MNVNRLADISGQYQLSRLTWQKATWKFISIISIRSKTSSTIVLEVCCLFDAQWSLSVPQRFLQSCFPCLLPRETFSTKTQLAFPGTFSLSSGHFLLFLQSVCFYPLTPSHGKRCDPLEFLWELSDIHICLLYYIKNSTLASIRTEFYTYKGFAAATYNIRSLPSFSLRHPFPEFVPILRNMHIVEDTIQWVWIV